MWNFNGYEANTFLIDEQGEKYSYSDLIAKAKEIYERIRSRCLVFSLCTNTVGSVVGYVSFLQNRVVPVLLNANLDASLLNNLIQIYLPSYLWIPSSAKENFQDYRVCFEALNYCLLETNFEKPYPLHEDLALLLTTSGSTGSPKFVRQSYDNIKANADSIIQYLRLDSTERPITTLPMNYTYGLSIINTHLAVGATLLVTEKGMMQKEFWEFFKEQKATSFGGVPYTYEMLDRLHFTKMDLPYLRTMTQAGGKITPQIHQKFAEYADKTGKKFVVMYGQCEATARMGYLPADRAVEKCGSMGIAIPGGRFRLIDVNGDEIKDAHVTGELVYEGRNVTMGYAECGDDLMKGDERHGTLATGDMAEFDEDGYYFIVGRKKRFLKIYGNRVNLDEIDRMIKGHFSELDVASSGVDDHMFIFMNDEEKMQDVKDFVSHTTGLNPVAFKTKYLAEIPKNDSGKVVYKDLEQYYKEEL
ncbi:MAG: AMP-binding protein [Lachnoclostridium sp.]|nr:AMP-binding protein [Lachnospira sp.]MCM1247296.1 AMP-binding protein [Lachnoclostridium sp.]MCM1534402.1 AMP-binding protein [Clostridium sp.]